ncbi:MAG: ABC transporter ATP-binding protein [bacterium]|nr:ABC transporter ATP-binding protein [bacterium]
MLKLNNITYSYNQNSANPDLLLQNFNLEILDGEFLSLVGPSGCGKTTLVNIIAGYLKPFGGSIIIDQTVVISPGKDRIVINQESDLFGWMTVLENMEIVSQDEVLIEQCLRLTHLSDFINYYPRQLSGGMKKRLSLARALAANPKFIIMDEPFGSLDNQIKEKLHEEVLKIVKQSKKTILLVTHDIEEALFLSDRILLLSGKPVIIKKEIKIPFNYPRDASLKDSAEFIRLRSSMRQAINHG